MWPNDPKLSHGGSQTPPATAEQQAPTAVGSGALLGITVNICGVNGQAETAELLCRNLSNKHPHKLKASVIPVCEQTQPMNRQQEENHPETKVTA